MLAAMNLSGDWYVKIEIDFVECKGLHGVGEGKES